jgi:uncharacterized membrane protein YvbJ
MTEPPNNNQTSVPAPQPGQSSTRQSTTAASLTNPRSKQSRKPIHFGCAALAGFLGLGVISVVIVIVLIAGGYIFNVSHRASHQTSPTEAVDSFLDATLNERNPDAVEKYLCNKRGIKTQVDSLIENLKDYKQKYPNNSVNYLWSSPKQTAKKGNHATVTSDVTARTIINGASSDAPTQTWVFEMVDQSGWKVCHMDTGG